MCISERISIPALNSHKIFYNTTLFPFRKVLTDKSLYIFINIPQNMPLIVLKTSELYVALFLLPVLRFQHLQADQQPCCPVKSYLKHSLNHTNRSLIFFNNKTAAASKYSSFSCEIAALFNLLSNFFSNFCIIHCNIFVLF